MRRKIDLDDATPGRHNAPSNVKNTDLVWTSPGLKLPISDFSGDDKKPKQTQSSKNKTAKERPAHTDYSVNQLAEEWGLSPEKIRELFRNEPGVIKLRDPNASKKRKRSYVTLRIPPDVAQRVKRTLT